MLRGATQPLRMPCVCVWKFFFLTRKHNRHTQNLISINKTYCSHRHKKHTYTHAIQKLKKNYSDAWLQYFLTRNNDSQINRVWPIRVKYPMFRYLGKKNSDVRFRCLVELWRVCTCVVINKSIQYKINEFALCNGSRKQRRIVKMVSRYF